MPLSSDNLEPPACRRCMVVRNKVGPLVLDALFIPELILVICLFYYSKKNLLFRFIE